MKLPLSLSFLAAVFAFAFFGTTGVEAAEEMLGAPHDKGIMFQEAATPVFKKIHGFHDFLLYVISAITILVLGVLMYICVRFRAKRNPNPSKTTHNTVLEIVWTVVPLILVVAILVPSIKLMYYMDKAEDPDMTLKVVAFQWHWGYEYPDHGVKLFESRPIADKDLKPGQLRLLEVDEPAYVPVGKTVRVLVTSADVIHSFAVPAFGIKRDAVPGRTNETWFRVDSPGTYYGQCSELCGLNHYFMPIKIVAVSEEEYAQWLKTKGGSINYIAEQEALKNQPQEEIVEPEANETPSTETPDNTNNPEV